MDQEDFEVTARQMSDIVSRINEASKMLNQASTQLIQLAWEMARAADVNDTDWRGELMFPGANARIFRNEAGEPVGWDYPDYDDPPDPEDFYDDPYYDDPDLEEEEDSPYDSPDEDDYEEDPEP